MALLEHIVQRRSTLSPWERAGGEGHLRMAGQASPPLEDSRPNPLPEGRGHVKLCPLRRHRRGERAALNEAPLRRRSRGERAPVKLGVGWKRKWRLLAVLPLCRRSRRRWKRRSSSARSDSVCPVWVHRFAVLTVGATLVLIFVGALVTSTGSGLAVPDWPLSFGQVFPPMVGGVLFEHGHRLVAALVGVLTVALMMLLTQWESRIWVRWLARGAVLAVLLQGTLGGMTVLLRLPLVVSVTHACLAQAFLCLVITLAVCTAPGWPGRAATATLMGIGSHNRRHGLPAARP